ncbi:nucleoside deaminase [Ohtaekwangia kribbensis]|uniref:Nucleoside deaminase n=1 Tax=Ohtaekwangia kribbensis TaxID=688913 RepID=A0ABW3K9G2_9BACT
MKRIHANEIKKKRYRKEMKDTDAIFMVRALELSHVALDDGHGHPFGSVVVRDGKIIGEGWNKAKVLHDPSAHAEVEAIRDACKNIASTSLAGSVIYASAQPCPMCLSLIYLTGIEKVYYCIPGDTIEAMDSRLRVEHIYRELAKPPLDRTIPEIPILPEEVDKNVGRYKVHYP